MRRLFGGDGLLFLKSAVLLALIRLALAVCSFRMLLQIVNRASATSSCLRRTSVPGGIERVQWAVLKASHCVPGTRHCLTRAFVAKMLFGRQGRPADLRIGVARDQAGRLVAHAWLESDGAPIFGVADSELRQYSLFPQFDRTNH